ncbi:glycosyltransferase family 4 protein [Roseimaritima multifibrata]|uniref:glycosyltransferase family 4 protein n=1 Tax=Roseimaritima multifibrata TaxID=1930274 RepID=UPI001C54F4C0|nr:glycosyltransferase family 4 protein [Roseimaritima multifibrata]
MEQPSWVLFAAFLAAAVVMPLRVVSAFRTAMRTRSAGMRSLVWHLFYIVEASFLARSLQSKGITHIHNHIAENSATVAMLACEIGGLTYSMTVHGPHEFYVASQIAFPEKLARAKFVACISHFCKSQCMAWSSPADWDHFHLVRCALDDAYFASSTPVPRSHIRFLSVGRLCPEKGFVLMVRAVAELKKMGVSVSLTIVGDGPSRRDIEEEINRHQLSKSVQLVGWKSNDEVRSMLCKSAVFVLPSFAEGLPVVIMEAFASGCAVIATRIAGIPELVFDGKNGWIVEPGDVRSLTKAMQEASTTSSSELLAMGMAGRRKVQESHNITHEVAVLASLLRQ